MQRARWIAVVVALAAAGLATQVLAAGPKFYFRLREVKAGPEVDAALQTYAGDALKAELAARPEWATDIAAKGTDELVTELNKRHLRGFDVTVRIESLEHVIKEPNPGARRKRLAVTTRLTVFGTTIPEAKMAFSGDGQAGLEGEFSEARLDAERMSLAKDAIKDAVKQAVESAVQKLSGEKPGPVTARRKKKS